MSSITVEDGIGVSHAPQNLITSPLDCGLIPQGLNQSNKSSSHEKHNSKTSISQEFIIIADASFDGLDNDSATETDANVEGHVETMQEDQTGNKKAWATALLTKSRFLLSDHTQTTLPRGSNRVLLNLDCFARLCQIKQNMDIFMNYLIDLELASYPDKNKCLLDPAFMKDPRIIVMVRSCSCSCKKNVKGAVHLWTIPINKFVILSTAKSRTINDVYMWAEWVVYTSKLCGNNICARPSHVIREDKGTVGARNKCHAEAKRYLDQGEEAPRSQMKNHSPVSMKSWFSFGCPCNKANANDF